MQPRLFRAAPAARLRRLTAFPALALAGLAAAACGGGGDGGSTGPNGRTTATFNVSAQTALAQGTTGATVRIVPSYTAASGNVALATQTANVSTGTTQASVPVDLAGCLGTTGSCTVSAAITLQAGGRTLDSTFVGPFTVKGGDTFTAAVSLAEVSAVQVTREGGAAVGGQPVVMTIGQTLDLAATALGPSGAALTRPVAWTSSAGTVATVDANGVITAVALGSARITASFAGREAPVDVVVQPALAVTRAGDGAGTVTSSPAGITCGPASAACSSPFAAGTAVTLTAAADANSTFTGWSGDCSGTAATCTVALGQNRAVTATFVAKRRVTLTVNVTNSGGSGGVLVTGGNVSPNLTTACTAAACIFTVDAGAAININAQPGTGSAVASWTGSCAGTTGTTCARTLTADATAGVTFGPRPVSDTVTVGAATTAAGGPFGGALQVSGFVNGNPTTTAVSFTLSTGSPSPAAGLAFDPSSPVTLQFQPNAQSRMLSWGGLCASATVDQTGVSTCTFTSTRNSQVTVNLGPR